jgi:ABC-type multidrug transport system fused ATPase/permease subunit
MSEGPVTDRKPPSFVSSIWRLYEAAHADIRRQIWVLALLTSAGAVSEVVAIGSVVPFLALLADPSATRHVPLAGRLFHSLGADTRGEQLVTATLFLCGAAIAAGVFRVILTRMTQSFAFSFGHRISVEIQRRTLLQPYSWHVAHNSSEQLATIEKVEIVATSVVLPLIQAVAASVLIFVVAAVLLQIAPLATVIAGISLGVAYYGLARFARRNLQANSRRFDTAFEERIRIVQEGLGGIRDVILEGSQATVLEQFRKLDLDIARARANTAFVAAVPRYLIEPAGIIIIAGLALFLSGRQGGLVAALPVLGALALGAQRLLPLVQQLFSGWSNVAGNRSVIDDVVRRLRIAIPPIAGTGPKLPFETAIEFRDVGFTYAGAGRPAVSGLNFEVRHGSRLALVGPTGSGKSTTADLLMGLLEASDGAILVDATPLDDKNRQAWRRNIAHVPQILFLADATIAQNIAMAEQADMDRVRKAASLAQLDSFISELPDGYETRIGERGARISGGQRQRLALARAIYKESPLLVLDEATSALDDDTEAAISAALDTLQEQGRTIVIIAHRSRLIATCDEVVRLQHGRITETPDRPSRKTR